jgi:hypothetical protein
VNTYTHDDLIEKARKWLWTKGCAVVITEMSSGGGQEPDAIGFYPTHSTLIECKASRSDFLNDKNKCHQRTGTSMGDNRYYLAPEGLIHPDELPMKWGLLEPFGKGLKIIRYAAWSLPKSCTAELSLLVSAMRRMKGVSVRYYTYDSKNRATLGVKKEGSGE